MIQKNKFTLVGHTQKVHGTDGELKVHVFDEFIEDFLDAEFAFLEIDGGKVPFFIENIRLTNTALVLFEDIMNNEDAVPYTNKPVYLQDENIIPDEQRTFITQTEDTLQYRRYINWQIIDKKVGIIGTIENIIEYPQQEMAVLHYQKREIMLPMTEGLIDQIDKENKMILMNLPDGLLDL